MPGFLYYLPGRSGLSLADAQTAGLGYALDGPLSTTAVRGGPDGGDGGLLALAAAVPPDQVRYEPAAQTWRKTPGAPIWVGCYADPARQPTLEDLARARQLAGHKVLLADGRRWLVPVARGWTDEDGELRWYQALPSRSRLADDGRWEPGSVLARFAPLWDLACRFEEARRQAILGAIPADDAGTGSASGTVQAIFDFDGLHQGAVEALATNYRIGPVESDLLGLLTWDISREILEALIDLPTRDDWFKKKHSAGPAAGSSTDIGVPVTTPDTDPR